ncbi:Autophagy-related protein 27 [Penicillium fimorum]|uniref:Autophagy-related protein 27 n=1 Tax=Penicillium fimorum TaxID=1882269 RepID=A0A9W9XIR1_9EURO|nr:Autophagy-related protein 27 [Penicillium fimorum]
MRIQSNGVSLLLSILPSLVSASASGFDCADIKIDNYKYDLSALKGVHELTHSVTTDDYVTNTTYRLNICNILEGAARYGDATCGTGKNVCGFVHRTPKDGNGGSTFGFPIVGLDPAGKDPKNPEPKRLKDVDPETEGLRVKLEGGSYKGDVNDQKPQKAAAIIDFQCDHERSGLEGLHTITEDSEKKERRRRADGEEVGAVPSGNSTLGDNNSNNSSSLQFKSFALSDDDTYILRLDWRTKYACDEFEKEKGDTPGSKSWGFFTWLIIIAFLCIAAYLIFGSWLNYNRYGARGWDLLPHGDTIRDIPYLFQDWLRRVVNTLQGAGSRGGYSAV